MQPGPRFTVIGENIHATRSLSRTGTRIVTTAAGVGVQFAAPDGDDQVMPLIAPITAGTEFAQGKVKHVRNALLLGLAGDGIAPRSLTGSVGAEAARLGREYLAAAALRQEEAGADYLDINVDEISEDAAFGAVAMDWLVRLLEPLTTVPLALDSSSPSILEAGCRASTGRRGPVMLNSASAERPDILGLAGEEHTSVVLSAAGCGLLPTDATGRLENAREIVERAAAAGISAWRMYVDLVVLPIGVAPQAGGAYLEAICRFRAEHGPEIRITGGLSNVSFGLPNRRLLNDVFVALAIDAGVDSGIVDPLATSVRRVLELDRSSEPFRLAAATLTGVDAFAIEYLKAHRAGRLAPCPAGDGNAMNPSLLRRRRPVVRTSAEPRPRGTPRPPREFAP